MHHPIPYSHDRFTTLWRPARRRSAANRSAFTLVELLVVIAVIVALLGLVAAVAPRFGERQRPSRGAGQLQSWLNLAKQRALRDQRPRGIRLPSVPNNAAGYAYITEVQFIELPEVFTGGQLWMPYDNTMTADRYAYVFLANVELGDALNPAIQPGDVLKDDSHPDWEPRRIRAINPGNFPPNATTNQIPGYYLTLDQDLGGPWPENGPTVPIPGMQPRQYPTTPPPPTEAYRILRAARPLPGEPLLTLPKDVGIDISRGPTNPSTNLPDWYRFYPPTGNTGGSGPFDIVFDPAGRVIGYESTLGSRICMWVRDISSDFGPTQMPDGDNSLITIYTRTGQISSHPIDPSGLQLPPAGIWNPFRFTQDGRSSGGQ